MRKLGIVGGTAWLSTVEYYSSLCRLGEEHHRGLGIGGTPATPEMVIESLDLRTALSYIGNIGDDGSWRRFDAYHRGALLRVAACGAQVALLASNTPHYRFDAITRGITIPVISIFDAVAQECVGLGAGSALILGTHLTMKSGALARVLAGHGIASFAPRGDAFAASIALIEDLQRNDCGNAGWQLHEIVNATLAGRAAEALAVCLCCTELPLAFPNHRYQSTFIDRGRLFVNSTAAHAGAAFHELIT